MGLRAANSNLLLQNCMYYESIGIGYTRGAAVEPCARGCTKAKSKKAHCSSARKSATRACDQRVRYIGISRLVLSLSLSIYNNTVCWLRCQDIALLRSVSVTCKVLHAGPGGMARRATLAFLCFEVLRAGSHVLYTDCTDCTERKSAYIIPIYNTESSLYSST